MAQRNLPKHDLGLTGGLRTNFEPTENAKLFLRQAQNVDTFNEFNSLGKVTGSTRVSDQHAGAVKSLHYFEYTALDGTRTREAISLDSTGVLYRINSDASLTSLLTGLVGEPLCGVTALDRLYLSGRSQAALTTGGILYDGSNVRSWGLVAPGDRIVVKESLDDSAQWSASTDATKSTDTAVKKDTVASVRVNKTGTATTEMYIERTGLALNISDGGNLLFVWLFIPGGALQKLATSGVAVEIRYGSTTLANAHRHQFSVGELIQGWNLLVWDRTTPDSTDGSGATLSNIQTIRLRVVFSSSAQTQSGFRWDKLYGTDNGKPTTADGGAGALAAATYRHRITFVDENGFESNAGPASTALVLGASKQISITAIPVSTDAKVIARRVYRDLNLDSIYLFVDQIDNNVSTSFTDNVPDASLGTAQPPLAGDEFFDNSPPEPFLDVELANNRVVGIVASDQITVVISNIGGPDGFPIVEQLQFEEQLTGLEGHALGTLIYATDKIFLMTGLGTADSPIQVFETTNQSGANGFRAKGRVKGTNVTVREDEAFFIGDPTDPWHINFDVLDQFQALDNASLKDMHVLHDRSRFRVLFVGKTGATYDTIPVYQYGTTGKYQVSGDGPGVDPQDLRLGSWRTLSLPSSIDPQCSAMIERTPDREELWLGGGDGYVYWVGDPTAQNWAKQLTSEAIDAQFTCAPVPLGVETGARGRPAYLEVIGTFPTQTTWTFTMTMMEDAEGREIETRSITRTFAAGPKKLRFRTGKFQCGHAEYFQLKVSNATTGGTGIFRRIRLYYLPRGDFAGPLE